MTLLEVVGISKSYGEAVLAVRDVSFLLDRGTILCLLGPSGSGKTTLLRLIAGLEQPDSGTIRFDDQDVTRVPPHQRGFGMMFQDFALFPHRNVRENVGFGLRMQGLDDRAIAERVQEMLALVELSDLAERSIAQLSGGEQQRVALARALAPGPQLLLLDEPLGALDRALRERLMLDLRAILKQVKMTAIYVTHDQTEAFAVGDQIAVMNEGRLVQMGTPQAIYERPATPFVARFLGFRNLVPGRVEAGALDTSVGCLMPAETPPAPGRQVTVLIKPFVPQSAIGEPAGRVEPNQVIATVQSVIFRGRFSQLRVEAGGATLLFEVAGAPRQQPGDVICISLMPEQIQIYELSG